MNFLAQTICNHPNLGINVEWNAPGQREYSAATVNASQDHSSLFSVDTIKDNKQYKLFTQQCDDTTFKSQICLTYWFIVGYAIATKMDTSTSFICINDNFIYCKKIVLALIYWTMSANMCYISFALLTSALYRRELVFKMNWFLC